MTFIMIVIEATMMIYWTIIY